MIPLVAQPIGFLCKRLQDTTEAIAAIDGERHGLIRACRDTSYDSIDELLFRRPRLREAGAISICAALIQQQLDVVRDRVTHQTWHSVLHRELLRERDLWRPDAPPDQSELLTIVTFNYDLCIEATIGRRYCGDTECDASEAWKVACTRPVLHVHGRLDLDEPICALLASDDHQAVFNCDFIRRAARGLAFTADPGEQLAWQEILATARQRLAQATSILFLGFGFDPNNLARIGIGPQFPPWKQGSRALWSTGVKMTDPERQRAANLCGDIHFYQSSELRDVVKWFLDDFPNASYTTIRPESG